MIGRAPLAHRYAMRFILGQAAIVRALLVVVATATLAHLHAPGPRTAHAGETESLKESPAPFPDPLPLHALLRFGSMCCRHPDGINSAALSADGKLLATAGNLCICIWELNSGRCIRVLRDCGVASGSEKGCKLAFSPDGKYLAHVCSYDVSARLWDVATGKPVRTFGALPPRMPQNAPMAFAAVGRFDGANSLLFSPDGKTLFVCSAIIVDVGATITCYDVASGVRLKKNTVPGEPLAFSADQRTFCTFPDKRYRPDNSRLLFCSTDTGAVQREFKITPVRDGRFARAVFAPDGTSLALADGGAQVRILDVRTGKDLRFFIAPVSTRDTEFTSLCFSRDGKVLLAGADSGFIGRYEIASGKELPALEGHPADRVTSLEITGCGTTLVSCSWDATIRRWHPLTGKPLPLPGGYASLTCASFSQDGAQVAAADLGAGRLDIWDSRTGRLRRTLQPSGAPICAVTVAPNSHLLAVGCVDGSVRLWDPGTSRLVGRLTSEGAPSPSAVRWIHCLRFSPDGLRVVAAMNQKSLVCWDIASRKRLWAVPAPMALTAAFSPDGKLLLTGGWDCRLHFHDAATGQERRVVKVDQVPESQGGPTFVDSIDFSSDGKLLATGHHDGLIRLWDPVTGTVTRFLPAHDDPIFCVRFSRDGAWLVSGSVDGSIRLFEVATGNQLLKLNGLETWIRHAEFSPDNKAVLSSGGNEILLWSTRPDGACNGDISSLWQNLASTDTRLAYGAVWALAARPADACAYVESRLAPIVSPTSERIAKLIRELDSPHFAAREAALKSLAELGSLAEGPLRAAAGKSPSPETARRLQTLLDDLRHGMSPAAARDLRAVQVLRLIGTPRARTLLRALSGGAAGAPLTQAARMALEALEPK